MYACKNSKPQGLEEKAKRELMKPTALPGDVKTWLE